MTSSTSAASRNNDGIPDIIAHGIMEEVRMQTTQVSTPEEPNYSSDPYYDAECKISEIIAKHRAAIDTLSGLRTVTMANQYKGKELWEVQIGGETAYYVGTLEEVIEKAKTHENYLHDEPLRGKPKPDQWNAGYPIGKIEKVGTLAG